MPLDSSRDPRIKSGVPIPPVRNGRESALKVIIDQMGIGDSVLCQEVGHSVSSFRCWAERQNDGTKFTARKTREGIRVWRVA